MANKGKDSTFGRGRRPIIEASDDPMALVLSSYELPVGLRELVRKKAKRMTVQNDLPMQSLSAYIRGCLIDFAEAPEPFNNKSKVWNRIKKRLDAGSQERVVKFLSKT